MKLTRWWRTILRVRSRESTGGGISVKFRLAGVMQA